LLHTSPPDVLKKLFRFPLTTTSEAKPQNSILFLISSGQAKKLTLDVTSNNLSAHNAAATAPIKYFPALQDSLVHTISSINHAQSYFPGITWRLKKRSKIMLRYMQREIIAGSHFSLLHVII